MYGSHHNLHGEDTIWRSPAAAPAQQQMLLSEEVLQQDLAFLTRLTGITIQGWQLEHSCACILHYWIASTTSWMWHWRLLLCLPTACNTAVHHCNCQSFSGCCKLTMHAAWLCGHMPNWRCLLQSILVVDGSTAHSTDILSLCRPMHMFASPAWLPVCLLTLFAGS